MHGKLPIHLGALIFMLTVFGSSPTATIGAQTIRVVGRDSLIHPGQKFQDCGEMLNGTRGYFHTPNFPAPFPVPCSCRWVIQAPSDGYHIIVYFTQLYLRRGLSATEYLSYSKYWGTVQETFIGKISADDKSTHLVSEYPFLSIDLELDDMTNANLRVLDNLMDVYGFNATYEVKRTKEPKKHCTVDRCSYNGDCLVDRDYQNFSCRCFPNFTGGKCQYGAECNPPIGINVCKNGGNCSYFGSRRFYCVCPTGFDGSHCEQRRTIESKECESLQCSHSCEKVSSGVSSGYRCLCNSGFYLAPSDNRTCISKGLIRFHGSIKLQNASYIPSKSDDSYLRETKKFRIESQLRVVIGERVQKLKNLSVLEFKEGGLAEVHFFAYENQSMNAKDVWTKSINESRFGTVAVSSTHLMFGQEHALSIQSLKVQHGGEMVIAGNEMMLTCVTYGSSQVQFNWFKDGVPVNHNFTRNNWNVELGKGFDDKHTAIFTVGIVEEAHAGNYTCRVTDWGATQERSLTIRVISSPRVTVTPRTLTIEKGKSVSITCLAALFSNKFGFNWTKNNKIHVSTDAELVEDIYPSGSRLKIASAQTSTSYSCVVSGATKSTQVETRITVINSHVIQVCTEEEKYGVRWALAATSTQDVQQCPTGFLGEAFRSCTTLSGKPRWEEPDFSRCIANPVVDQQFKLDNMKLGFMLTTPMDILINLSNYLKSREQNINPGEGEPVLNLLKEVMNYQNLMSSPLSSNFINVFFDIISRQLMSQNALNKEEQVVNLLRMVQQTTEMLGEQLHRNLPLTIDRKALAIDIVQRYSSSSQRVFVLPRRLIDRDWYTDVVTVSLEGNFTSQRDSSDDIAVISYQNIAKFLPKRSSTKFHTGNYYVDVEYELNSHVVTVAHIGAAKALTTRNNGFVQVSFSKTLMTFNRTGWNVSCAWSNISIGSRLIWSLDDCTLIVTDNATNCICNKFGTYAVLFTSPVNMNFEAGAVSLDTVVAFGCFVGCVMVLLTLVCLIVCWRAAFRGFVVMKIHVCIGLFGAMLTILVASQFTLPTKCYPYVSTLVEFFLLEPLTMHVCLELFLYLELANVRHIQNAIAKITLLGWGIPTLVTGATVVVQSQEGFNFDRWWMQVGDTYFLGFTISAVILLLLYLLLYLVVNLELRQSMSIGSPKQITIAKRMGLLRRSLILQLAITAFVLVNIIRGNYNSLWYRYTFATVVGATGFLTFLLYTVRSENPGCICSSSESASSVKSSAEMSTRSTTTTSSLPKPEDLTNDVIQFHPRYHPIVTGLYSQRASLPIRQCPSGETDFGETADLLKMTTTGTTDCNSAVLSDRRDATTESFLDSYTNSDDHMEISYVNQLRPSNNNPKKTKKLIEIVDYEGSPKKYHTSTDLVSGMCGLIMAQPCPVPETSICYLRTSPASLTTSTSADYSFSKPNRVHLSQTQQQQQRSDCPLDITFFQTHASNSNRLPDVSCHIDGQIRRDRRDTVV